MRILVVEDEPVMQRIVRELLLPLRERFPNSTFIIAPSREKALEIIHTDPPPDTVILDLTLTDSSMQQTLDHLTEIQERCPTVILTGSSKSVVEPYAQGVEVVDKMDAIKDKGLLTAAIVRAVQIFKNPGFERLNGYVDTLRDLISERKTPHAATQ